MKDTERHRLEMFLRADEFGTTHAAQFPVNSFAPDQATLAAWFSASHVVRTPRSSSPSAPQGTTTT
jgi:hypothetical protein